MRISVVGTGYVGLVTGVCFSELGYQVTCIDRDEAKIATLQAGDAPFFEPGLSEMMQRNVAAGRLSFAPSIAAAGACDILFIAVGSPPGADGLPDTSALWQVVDAINSALTSPTLVVIKSTMPPGTARAVGARLNGHDIASNPEFLREGSAISDFMHPDRVVVGTLTEDARTKMKRLYAPLGARVFVTGLESAEMIKYASNDLLAARIAYINEMADICEHIGADIVDVAHGMGLDARIGPHFLRPGPGFGGSCFPKDVLALVEIARRAGTRSRLLEATLEGNDARKHAMATRLIAALGGDVRGKRVAILGLTFKANTDDMREAPSLTILPALLAAGAQLQVYDPEGMGCAKPLLDTTGITWCSGSDDALRDADAAMLITEWAEFRTLLPDGIAALLKGDLFVDLRNQFDPAAMRAAGLRYLAIGRPA